MNILLTETKKEYTKSLCRFITPQIYRGIKSIFEDSNIICFSALLKGQIEAKVVINKV